MRRATTNTLKGVRVLDDPYASVAPLLSRNNAQGRSVIDVARRQPLSFLRPRHVYGGGSGTQKWAK